MREVRSSLVRVMVNLRRSERRSSELTLRNSVKPLYLLLFAELLSIVRGFSTPILTMLSRGISTPFKRTLIRVTAVTLEKQLLIFTPAKPAYRSDISSHDSLLYYVFTIMKYN